VIVNNFIKEKDIYKIAKNTGYKASVTLKVAGQKFNIYM